jgi:hypothetical protein
MKVYTFMKDATIRTNSMFATKLQSHLVEATRIVFVLLTMMSKQIIVLSFIVKITIISFLQTETVELGSKLQKDFPLEARVSSRWEN